MQRAGVGAGAAALETGVAGDHGAGAEVDVLAGEPLAGEGPGPVVDHAVEQGHFGRGEFGEDRAALGRVVFDFFP